VRLAYFFLCSLIHCVCLLGESRGFGFLAYEDQRSTDLAVDNLNGIQLLGWTMRVNHVKEYRPPSAEAEEEKQGASLLF
jgi:RNA recognition motif-containing protein